MNDKIIVLDAFSLIYKAFYGVRPMSSSKGIPTNAVYGFMSMLLKLIREEKPKYIFAAFDTSKDTFRARMYPGYKADRQKMPEDLAAQIPYIIDLLKSANIMFLSCDGYEADDIIGFLSALGDKHNDETLIVTGDRDSFQLASSKTTVLYSKRGISDTIRVDEDYIRSTYGIEPAQLTDVKSLMGDQSDRIPGVSGVGEKTALSLIQKYGTLDNVYLNIDEQKGKLKEKLTEGRENAYLSRDLAEIKREIPLDFRYEDADDTDFRQEAVYGILKQLELSSMIKAIGFDEKKKENEHAGSGKFVFEQVQSADLSAFKGRSAAYCLEKGPDSYMLALADENSTVLMKNVSVSFLKDFFEDEKISKISYDIKETYKLLDSLGICAEAVDFDVYIAAYLCSPSDSRYGIEQLSLKYLDEPFEAEDNKPVQQLTLFGTDDDEAVSAAAKKAHTYFRLAEKLKEKLRLDGMSELYSTLEHPLIKVLADMEITGFRTDQSVLMELDKEFDKKSAELTSEIYSLAGKGEDFNINSTKQLGAFLFDELGLPIIKKTKTGYSTDIEVLEKLEHLHPVIPKIIELRAISKLSSTYIKGMMKLIGKNGRIHTSFNQTITATGRLSSSNPNLQNIPVRTEEGRIIRKAFVASDENHILIDADYSQIELRILAHISEDKSMIDAFIRGEDIHTRTASEVFGVSTDEVTKSMRSDAKAVNFGIVYGISDFGLSKNIGISRKEAGQYIKRYFERFPGVDEYMKTIVLKARQQGFVETMFGRRCYVPDINSANFNMRSFAERIALNAPIQGSAADIIKIAMNRIFKRLCEENLKAKLILQVHDELIIDCPAEESSYVKTVLKEEMENAASLSVPLTAQTETAQNWYDAK